MSFKEFMKNELDTERTFGPVFMSICSIILGFVFSYGLISDLNPFNEDYTLIGNEDYTLIGHFQSLEIYDSIFFILKSLCLFFFITVSTYYVSSFTTYIVNSIYSKDLFISRRKLFLRIFYTSSLLLFIFLMLTLRKSDAINLEVLSDFLNPDIPYILFMLTLFIISVVVVDLFRSKSEYLFQNSLSDSKIENHDIKSEENTESGILDKFGNPIQNEVSKKKIKHPSEEKLPSEIPVFVFFSLIILISLIYTSINIYDDWEGFGVYLIGVAIANFLLFILSAFSLFFLFVIPFTSIFPNSLDHFRQKTLIVLLNFLSIVILQIVLLAFATHIYNWLIPNYTAIIMLLFLFCYSMLLIGLASIYRLEFMDEIG